MGGVVSALKEKPLKSGKGRMAFVTLEDLHGSCEILVFSRAFEESEAILKSDEPILIHGSVMVEGDDSMQVKLRARSVEKLADARASKTSRFDMEIPVYELDNQKLKKLREILSLHHGDVPTQLTLTSPELFETTIVLPQHLRVNPSDELLSRVEDLFGKKIVRLN